MRGRCTMYPYVAIAPNYIHMIFVRPSRLGRIGGSGPRGPPRGGLDNVRGLDSIRGRDHSKSKLSARFFGQIFNLPFLFSFPNAFIPFNFQVHCLPVVPAVADC